MPDTTVAVMDERTLSAVVRDFAAPLHRYVTRLAPDDQHLAEEVVQETLVRAWQRPEIVNDRHVSLRPWLFTVARNLVNDHWRARRARALPTGEGEMTGIPEQRDRIEETVQAEVVRQGMARLAPAHREALVHVYYGGRSTADTAALLGVPVGTVKSRVYYALKQLRVVLDASALRDG
jgi:RNA polymerase sigma-70 factor (ECF subfamily)